MGSFPKSHKGARYKLHINGIKNDNRIENLLVMTQAEHAKQDYFLRKRNEKGQLL